MKKLNLFLFAALWLYASVVSAQVEHQFTNCSAAFLDNKMVVNEYTVTGKCTLPAMATGKLTVCTADLSPERSIPVNSIKFMVAIRDANNKTMMMYSNDTYKELDIQRVLSKCRKGDSIVLLTMDDEYALPHNEIFVE